MQDKVYSIEEIKEIIDSHKNFFRQKYFVEEFFLFGSYAKNQQTANSDIDLLVKLSEPIDMFEFIDLQENLSKIFNKKIDLGTINGLKNFVRNTVLKEAIAL